MTDTYILHPNVVIGVEADQLLIKLGDQLQFSTPDADLALTAIGEFLAPVTKVDAASALAAHDVDITELIDVFEAEGIIIPARIAVDVAEGPRVIRDSLAEIVDLAHRIAGDVAGLGRDGIAGTCGGTQAGLQGALLRLARIEVNLRAARGAYLAGQLRALGLERARELKLHLGASNLRIPGWVNIDVAPAELAMDLRWGLPFDDGAVHYVFLSHFLEHLSEAEARQLLADIHRALIPGGVVRVIVPSFRRYAEAYVERDARFFAKQAEHWEWAGRMRTDLERMLRYAAGADADPRSFMTVHRYGYDFETLALLLREVGFAAIEESAYLGSSHAALQIDHHTAYAGVSLDGRSFSLFVEATK